MQWDFTKLPESEHEAVLSAYAVNDWETLLDIHNRYKLKGELICCNPQPQLANWFGYAIEQGIIKPVNSDSEGK